MTCGSFALKTSGSVLQTVGGDIQISIVGSERHAIAGTYQVRAGNMPGLPTDAGVSIECLNGHTVVSSKNSAGLVGGTVDLDPTGVNTIVDSLLFLKLGGIGATDFAVKGTTHFTALSTLLALEVTGWTAAAAAFTAMANFPAFIAIPAISGALNAAATACTAAATGAGTFAGTLAGSLSLKVMIGP
jgi:hypothetical protein